MGSSNNSVTIAPSFTSTVRALLAMVLVAVVAIPVIKWIRGESPFGNLVEHWSSEETLWVLVAIGFFVVCAAFISSIGRYAALVVTPQSISGRTESGRRLEIPTNSVSYVEFRPNPMVPGLYVGTRPSEEKILAILWGVDISRVSDELTSTIGPTHALSRWFQDHAT